MLLEKPNRAVKHAGKVTSLQHKVLNAFLHDIRNSFRVAESMGDIDFAEATVIPIPFELITANNLRSSTDKKEFAQVVDGVLELSFREIDGKNTIAFNAFEYIGHNFEERRVFAKPTGYFYNLCKKYYLEGGFISLPSDELLPIGSVYSLKFFELLKQYTEVERTEVVKPIKWLREWLSIGDKYPLFSDFRKWVLETAHREINSKTNLRYEFELIKRGRVVESVRFYGIEYRSAVATPPALLAPAPAPDYSESEKLLISAGVEGSAVQQIAQLYPDPAFIRSLIAGASKTKNPAGYIVSKAGERWREWGIKQNAKTAPKTVENTANHNRTPEKIENDRKRAEIARKRVAEYDSLPDSLKNAVLAYKSSPEGGGVLFLSDPQVYAAIADRLQFDPETGKYAVQQDFTENPSRGMGLKK